MIRVVLAEDVHMVRGALVALLALESDIEVVAETGNGSDVLRLVGMHRPDIALLDIDMPGVDGLTLAQQIRSDYPAVKRLMLTSLGSPGAVQRALAAHVDGFLLKDADPSSLADSVRRVVQGERVVDGHMMVTALEQDCPLSERELDVLRRAAHGEDPVEIAAALFLSAGTVRNHLSSILSKLGARNRVDAVRIAARGGWI